MRRNLTRKERIKKKSELKRVFNSAKSVYCRGLKLLYVENGFDYNRIAVSPVKRFDGAVSRNREKRVIRELFRLRKPELRKGYDFVFIVYPGAFSFYERQAQLDSLFDRTGLKE